MKRAERVNVKEDSISWDEGTVALGLKFLTNMEMTKQAHYSTS